MPIRQYTLDLTPAQRLSKRREKQALYDAAVNVRRHGKTCYRAGRNTHTVDGMRMTDEQLLAHSAHLDQKERQG